MGAHLTPAPTALSGAGRGRASAGRASSARVKPLFACSEAGGAGWRRLRAPLPELLSRPQHSAWGRPLPWGRGTEGARPGRPPSGPGALAAQAVPLPLSRRPWGSRWGSRQGESTRGRAWPLPTPSAPRMLVRGLPSPAPGQEETPSARRPGSPPGPQRQPFRRWGRRDPPCLGHAAMGVGWAGAGGRSLTVRWAERRLRSVSQTVRPGLSAAELCGAAPTASRGEPHPAAGRRPFRFSSWPWPTSPWDGFLLLFLCEGRAGCR